MNTSFAALLPTFLLFYVTLASITIDTLYKDKPKRIKVILFIIWPLAYIYEIFKTIRNLKNQGDAIFKTITVEDEYIRIPGLGNQIVTFEITIWKFFWIPIYTTKKRLGP